MIAMVEAAGWLGVEGRLARGGGRACWGWRAGRLGVEGRLAGGGEQAGWGWKAGWLVGEAGHSPTFVETIFLIMKIVFRRVWTGLGWLARWAFCRRRESIHRPQTCSGQFWPGFGVYPFLGWPRKGYTPKPGQNWPEQVWCRCILSLLFVSAALAGLGLMGWALTELAELALGCLPWVRSAASLAGWAHRASGL